MPPAPKVVANPRPSTLSATTDGRAAGLHQLSLNAHPLYQSVTDGHVIKAPMFTSTYKGTKDLAMAVVGASARFTPSNNIALTGKLLGPVSKTDSAVYSFLIDRGGAPSPGPLKIRPRILYDAEVKVATGATGTEGSISLLDSQGQFTTTSSLPSAAVRVSGATINVLVPSSLLPSTTASTGRQGKGSYRYTFTAAVPDQQRLDIASFAPEYVPAVIKPLSSNSSSASRSHLNSTSRANQVTRPLIAPITSHQSRRFSAA